MLRDSAKDKPANSTESVDCNFNCHSVYLFLIPGMDYRSWLDMLVARPCASTKFKRLQTSS
jgi:hypothetical protein